MDNKVDIITAIGVIITAILGGINIYISYQRNMKSNYINTITAERIRWITSLKELLSEFISLNYYDHKVWDKEYKQKVAKAKNQIKLYLNKNDKFDKAIIRQVDICSAKMLNLKTCSNNDMNKLVNLSQKMFKNEWERVKRESKYSDIDKKTISFFPKGFHQWFRLVIGLLGAIIGVLFTSDTIGFDTMAGIVTIVGFLGYTIDGLLLNVDERKSRLLNNKEDR